MLYARKLSQIFTFIQIIIFLFLMHEISIKASSLQEPDLEIVKKKQIKNIIIQGERKNVPEEAILARLPYRIGDSFDPSLSAKAIKNIVDLKLFTSVEIAVQDVSDNELNIYIILPKDTKKKLESVSYKGNKNLKESDIEKKLKISEILAIDQEEAEQLAQQIKKLYIEKNYHDVNIETQLIPTENNNVSLEFNITEGIPSVVKQVRFTGNKYVPSKTLRGILLTREDWILGFLNKAGMYHPEMLEADKRLIENYYQNSGFLAARVSNVDVKTDPKTKELIITFDIDEGDLYVIKSVSAPGNELISEAELLSNLPLRAGQYYNRSAIVESLDLLRLIWGKFGYVNAEVDPQIKPNFDDKTVDITFVTELSRKVFLNRINIIGNTKTRDYVIRRNILLNEGEILTTPMMEISKNRIESLGFFDPKDGVEWKVKPIDDNTADLDLILKEIRTGSVYGQVGFGGAEINSPTSGLKVSAGVSDRNLLGTGIRYNLNVSFSREDRMFNASLFQPWLFNRQIGGGLDFFHRRLLYEDFKNVRDIPIETTTGGTGQLTVVSRFFPNLVTSFQSGIENIRYDRPVLVAGNNTSDASRLFQSLLNLRFQSGALSWLGLNFVQDFRNHPMFPSRGYHWVLLSKFGFPTAGSNFGFFKLDLDATWLVPLINEFDLIFKLHGHFGFIKPFSNTRSIPYRELYHIGGPSSVRGFTFGQIGPQIRGDSLGAQKAFWLNAELIFSITKDQSIKGVLFYDGGAGWDTPNISTFPDLAVQNNSFRYRHSVGFGIRLTQPTPLRVDWGFKLDRNKRLGETAYEVHFNVAQDF